MKTTHFWISLCLVLLCAFQTCAQSFLLKLPRDGTWATYENSGTVRGNGVHQYDWEGPLTIRCVGTEYEQMEALRWIEFEQKMIYTQGTQHVIIKVLVPEDEIGLGKDPLAHVRKCWYCCANRGRPLIPQEVDVKTNKQVRHVLSQYLAPPLQNKTDLTLMYVNLGEKKALGESKMLGDPNVLGDPKVLCEGIRGTLDLEFHDSMQVVSKRTYELYSNPTSPFGLVKSNYEFVDTTKLIKRTSTKTSTCKLLKTGTGARSKFPDCK